MASTSHAYPPTATSIAFPPPPPTSNTLSSKERSVLVRSSRKLSRVLGDTPRFVDQGNDVPPVPSRPSTSSGLPELTRTSTVSSFSSVDTKDAESTWRKRKPTHLPPLLKLSNGVPVDSSSPTLSPVYQRPPTRRGSVLSTAQSIVSNASGSSSNSDVPSENSQRRTKLERLRRKLGDEVPTEAVFPSSSQYVPETPRTAVPKKPSHRARSHSVAHPDDARSITFSISSDESVQTVTFTASTRLPSPHPHKTKQTYQTGALPPVPPLPSHLTSSSRRGDDDNAGLLRPRQKMAAGSKIGGSDFKAARRAKREGRPQTGHADVGELVEMVGFLH